MQNNISFLFKEVITGGAVLSTFELVEALRKLGVNAYIISKHRNPELEEYFGITIFPEPVGITVAVSPKCKAQWAYVRTKDPRWLKHKSKKIAVSKWIADWLTSEGESAIFVLGNGTHSRFKNLNIKRDIDCLLVGNYEENKNIENTVRLAKQQGSNVVWFGRTTKEIEGVDNISNPRIEDIPKIYNRAKTFISASKEEGWGRPVAEAKACGCKIINLNGGNREIEIVSWQSIARSLISNLKIC